MQVAVVDIYTQVVASITSMSDGSNLPQLPNNQLYLTDADWSVEPSVGDLWDGAKPALFSSPPQIQSMSQAQFVAALGANLQVLWASAGTNLQVTQFFAQGLTTDPITRDLAYTDMLELEQAGVLAVGTTAGIWG